MAVVGSPVSEPRTPTAERSSGEEPVAEGLPPAAERSLVEELVAVVGNLRPVLRTLDATMTSTAAITTDDGRSGLARWTTAVERSSGEEPVTSGMREGLRPSREADPATERSSENVDVDSDLHTAIGAHPPVDRSSTGVPEMVDALTEPSHASRTPSAYRASTETGTEAQVPGMNNIAGGPTVDRTPTEGGETLALTSAPVAEEPRGDPAMVETFIPRFGAATQDSKVETSPVEHGRPSIVWGQGIQIRPSMNLPQPSDFSSFTLAISQASVSDAISRLQQEKARVQKDLDNRKAEFIALSQRYDRLLSRNDVLVTDYAKQQQLIKSLHNELGEIEAEFDDEDDDPLLRRIRRECEKRVKDCEERLKQSQAERHR